MKKMIILFLFLFIIPTSCPWDRYDDGYILYKRYGNGKNIEYEFVVCGLTDLGKEQEYIIIPSYFKGIKVDIEGTGTGGIHRFGKVKKVFVPYEIDRWHNDPFNITDGTPKVFMMTNYVGYEHNEYRNLYVSSWFYNNVKFSSEVTIPENTLSEHQKYGLFVQAKIANVSYHFNYENSPNEGYYWIDDYDYGEKIDIIPPVPTREGYEFCGWYTEPECINKWDYDNDRLPEATYDEDGKVIFNELELYAKWE